MALFSFPGEPVWNTAEQAVEFTVQLGGYEGKIYVGLRVFHDLVGHRPSPDECVQWFHLNRTVFERITEAKVRARELDQDANLRITARDVRRTRS